MYEITIRNQYGEKIVKRYPVETLDITLNSIIDDNAVMDAVHIKISGFIAKYGRDNLKYFWFPENIPQPPPAPMNIDMENILLAFRAAIVQNISRDFEKTIAEIVAAS